MTDPTPTTLTPTTTSPTTLSPTFALADRYVAELAQLDPITGTQLGVADVSDRLTDFSPAGQEERADLARSVLAALESVPPTGESDRVAGEVLRERLGSTLEQHDAGDGLRDVNILACPVGLVREVFDVTPTGTPEQLDAVVARLLAIPAALASWRESLDEGRERDLLASRRQTLAVARQAATFGGADDGRGWFTGWAASLPASGGGSLGDAAEVADAAYRETARWLRGEYAPAADPADGVGEQRYGRAARVWTGASLDLARTYEWGWEELDRITSRMRAVADVLVPGGGIAAAKDMLESDERYALHGTDELLSFLRDLTARAIDGMSGAQFDIDPRIRECDVRLAAEGTAAAPYYQPPSEDLSRPGSTWFPTLRRERFPRWWLVSVWYHESVPGHHLQIATAMLERERLSRFQRTVGWTAGHAEGWALYAERLMDELGWFAGPAEEMGFLAAQAMRAARVVVDIGLHLGLRVPVDADDVVGGRVIDFDVAVDLMRRRALLDAEFATSEVNRYLGLPGQAISYKVGERVWLDARAQARTRRGAAFDLKDWHMHALRLGPMGLDPFLAEMSRY